YNERGAMTAMPHLPALVRDHQDQIRRADLDLAGSVAWYAYDAGGQRVRKQVDKGGVQEERIYVGGYEVWRKRTGSRLQEERQTLHVMDDQLRIALVETLTVTNGSAVPNPTPRLRYQLGDHLGTATLEVDEVGAIIDYEEYHPYGTTAWWATNGATDFSSKRYLYTGKERDDETSLGYHGARYYVAWLGRWERVDPARLADGPNRFGYCRGSPIRGHDSTGTRTVEDGVDPVPDADSDASVDEDMLEVEVVARRDPTVWDRIKADQAGFIREVVREMGRGLFGIHTSVENEDYAMDAAAKYTRGAADSASTVVTSPYSPVNWGMTPILGADAVEAGATQVVSGPLDALLGPESKAPGDYFYEGGYSSEQAVSTARAAASLALVAGAVVRSNPWNAFQRGNIGRYSTRAEASAAYRAARRVRASSPVTIPDDAEVRIQAKVGYDQISFRWRANTGERYEARWHTRTPGAPPSQGDTWVVSRRTPGTATGQRATEHVLSGNQWVSMYDWMNAVLANQNAVATQAQLDMLRAGHFSAGGP
ncbi:MAG: RHS repeat-associated core domain-containing protein, partial [Myxococcota bacterium]